ncbi:hypothetical protein PF003_g27999 [Phytophthora fragariae]|nr:hypothetical protein PF003_g27999 [Phytophthora fragariae]
MVLALYAGEAEGQGAPPPFTASDHWVSSFIRRFEISLRLQTNLTVLDDDTLVGRAVRCMVFLQAQLPPIDLEQTVLMDKTAVYFEDPRQTTVGFIGAQHVVVRSTGFSSIRIMVVLAVSATGRKFPPLLVWKGKSTPTFGGETGPLYVAQQRG